MPAPNRAAQTARVTGLVTVDGQPAPGLSVMFLPAGPGRPALGRTDQNGHYELTTFRQGDGALVGGHRVAIAPSEDPAGAWAKKKLPARYREAETSALSVEVQPGRNEFHFDLTTD
jgi:hypothetical protein